MFKQLLDKLTNTTSSESNVEHDMQQVSVQLMLEVARSDAAIDDIERDTIINTILGKSGLTAAETQALLSESEEAVDKSISFHQHVRLVNEQFDYPQKVQLIEQMWRVAYADEHLDAYEEAFVRQVADLVYVRHRDFMQAKLRVTEAGN